MAKCGCGEFHDVVRGVLFFSVAPLTSGPLSVTISAIAPSRHRVLHDELKTVSAVALSFRLLLLLKGVSCLNTDVTIPVRLWDAHMLR